jgi:hypothetical protein
MFPAIQAHYTPYKHYTNLWCPFHQVIHALGRVMPQFWHNMTVGVHGDTDLTVAKNLHDYARMNALS